MNKFEKLNLKPLNLLRLSMLAGVIALAGCDTSIGEPAANKIEKAEEAEYQRGPQRGRLLEDGAFAVEVTIFETGVEPQFRIYAYENGDLLDPSKVGLTIKLGRLDRTVDHFDFQAEGDYLVGDGVVIEPHSFDVMVSAHYKGQDFSWDYPSYEGRTMIPTKMADAAEIETEDVGPAVIEETLDVLGRIDLAPRAKAVLRARFHGQVLAVYKTVGENVKAGERLASIESNDSLQTYDVTSPIDGMVLERHTNVGDVTGLTPLFVVGDLTQLRVDFHVFPKDLHRVAVGQSVAIKSVDDRATATAEIQAFLPTKELETQTVIARALLPNKGGKWLPGMTVQGDIVIHREKVPLAVRTKALQRFRDFTVVFAKVDETYEVRMLELGRQTEQWTEVLGGIIAGQEYVVENSFLIKADIEKSGASHDH